MPQQRDTNATENTQNDANQGTPQPQGYLVECRACSGTGKILISVCDRCNGTGRQVIK